MLYGASKLRITSFRLSDADPDVAVVANGEGNTNLNITFDRQGKTFSATMVVKKVRLWVKTNAAKRIIECRSAASGNDQLWQRTASNPTKIFYSDGDVGVGVANPVVALDVNGPVKIRGTNQACDARRVVSPTARTGTVLGGWICRMGVREGRSSSLITAIPEKTVASRFVAKIRQARCQCSTEPDVPWPLLNLVITVPRKKSLQLQS